MSSTKTALITGAASGIGLCVTRRLAADGHRLVLLDRSESVRSVADELAAGGAVVDAVVADLASIEQIRESCDTIDRLAGGCDILINNAGVHLKRGDRVAQDDELTLEEWELTMRINTTAPFLLSQYALRGMVERGWGRIVNIASRAGRTASHAAGTHYSTSKAALIGMTRSMAAHYAAKGITINAVAPGHVLTPLAQQHKPETLARSAREIPMGRLGQPDEIAAAVHFLTRPDASFITGTVIDANGGGFMG